MASYFLIKESDCLILISIHSRSQAIVVKMTTQFDLTINQTVDYLGPRYEYE